MSVPLPAPRLGGGRLAHHGHVIAPLAVPIEVVVIHLPERVVQAHDVARLLEPFRAQPCAQQRDPRFALRVRHLEKTDALPNVEILIHPLAPFGIVHPERRLVALRLGDRREKRFGGFPYGFGRHTGRSDGKQTRLDLPIRRDPLEWRRQAGLLEVRGHLTEALRALRVRFLLRRLRGSRLQPDTAEKHHGTAGKEHETGRSCLHARQYTRLTAVSRPLRAESGELKADSLWLD